MSGSETIFALSSGAGRAGIAVVRVSGGAAKEAVLAVIGSLPEPREASYRSLRDSQTGELIDRGMVLWLPGPGTATGEDMAEFHVHGSSAVVQRLCEALKFLPHCRQAEAGEFTRRAFRNGKLDLVEAEGLADLLAAEGEVQRRQALYHMAGVASGVYQNWFNEAMAILARLEAAIDFVDEADVAEQAMDGVRSRIAGLVRALDAALAGSVRADAIRNGLRIVIIGPPNAGKSSLLNWLAAREAAIVSPIAGTTRDVIEVSTIVAGVPVSMIDTAGLRDDSGDEIEQLGMQRARAAAAGAHLVIELSSPDSGFVPEPGNNSPRLLRVFNKIDLAREDSIHSRNKFDHLISTKTGAGLASLWDALERFVQHEFVQHEPAIVARERHRESLKDSIRLLNESLSYSAQEIELAAEAVRGAAHSLARITGRVDVEDLLGRIFSEFCVGK